MSNFFHFLGRFAEGQVLGWCLLAALAAVCGGVLVLLFRVVRREPSLSAVVWTWGMAILSVVLAGARIAQARQQALGLLLKDPQVAPWESARVLAVSFERIVVTQFLVSWVLAPAMLALLLAALWGRPRPSWRGLAALAASLLLLTFVAVHVGTEGFAWPRSCTGGEDLSACLFEQATDSVRQFQLAARCVVYAGALVWAIALLSALRAARERIVIEGRVSLASTALLFTGIGAFWATRAEHADAQHLVPPDSPSVGRYWIDERLQDQLPAAKPGCSALSAPFIEFRADGTFVDGTLRGTPTDLRTVLAGKRELWEQLNRNVKFPGLVVLAATRGARAADLLPWLLAANQAGYAKVGALLRVPTATVQTRSVGALEFKRSCVEVQSIDGTLERAFTYFETWGDLVAAGGVAPPPDPYARSSERSRCSLLSAPASPALASLFGKARRLHKRDDLDALMNQAKTGAPERIALRVEGTGSVSCECPPFEIRMSEPGEPSLSLLAVPKKGVANFGLRRTLLNLIVVGYFTGAWIDSYEYLHTQGEDHPATDEETRSSYLELAAEFCLEASCYSVREFHSAADEQGDKAARKANEDELKRWRALAAEDAADMARIGIPKCEREWLRDPPLVDR